ncbi:MAG: hypothetical protein KKG92_15445, partial [Gammaproteobacteria bacterium]|nr:hypothetical protein [Gammaproteobacteria bacterium]
MKRMGSFFVFVFIASQVFATNIRAGSQAENIVFNDARYAPISGGSSGYATLSGTATVCAGSVNATGVSTFDAHVDFNSTVTVDGLLTLGGVLAGTSTGTTLDIIPTTGDYLRVGDAG